MPLSKAYLLAYKHLPERLEQHYPNLPFSNHCYLRMALDVVIGNQWDLKIKKPAYRHLNPEQLQCVVHVLKDYLTNNTLIIEHHAISLRYRAAYKGRQQKLKL